MASASNLVSAANASGLFRFWFYWKLAIQSEMEIMMTMARKALAAVAAES